MIALKCNLPDGWKLAPLAELCEINPAKPDGFKRDADAPTTFIPMEAVDDKIGAVVAPQVRPYSSVARGYTYFEEGDIIFAKITPCMQNGKTAIVTGLLDGIGYGSTEFHVLRAKPGVDPRWIYHLLRTAEFRRKAEENFEGSAGQRRVPEHFLKAVHVPAIENANTQGNIIALLDERLRRLIKMRAAAERQLEASLVLRNRHLRQFFTPQLLPTCWQKRKLGELCDVVNGFGFPKHLQGRTDLPYPFVKVSDMNTVGSEETVLTAANTVNDEILRAIGGRAYPAGTIIFPKVGGALLTNKKRILGVPGSFDNNIMGLVPRGGVLSKYLLRWMETFDLAELANTQALPSLRQSDVENVEIPLPGDETAQAKVVEQLEKIIEPVNSVLNAVRRQLDAIEALPAATLREFFNFGSEVNA